MKSIGLDIGGTNIKGVVIDNRGEILRTYVRKSNYYVNDYTKNIVEIIDELLNSCNGQVEGIGIGVPGIVDYKKGNIISCPALSLVNFNLKKYIEEIFKLKVKVENDVNAWTIGEKYFGCGKTCTDFIMITIGTGIGCGIYINDNIYRGASFEAGEIGYMPIGLDAYKYQCSNHDFGYFESNASANSVGKKYKEKSGEELECKEIFIRAEEGDEAAIDVVEEVYKYLGIGISAIRCIINPQKIVIGGGMANQGEKLKNEVKENIKKLIPLNTVIELSKTGEFGGAIGSAQMNFIKG